MSKYLLDTNVVSELRKRKPHGGVVAWMDNISAGDLFLSAVTMGELQTGIELTRSQDPEKAREIEEWANRLEETFQVLSMDAACFREWARLMAGKPHHLLEDLMIAATARVHGLKLASRNLRHFIGLGVEVVNPFAPGAR